MKQIDSFRGEYRFLSNFAAAPVIYDGVQYLTVEHAYQAAKSLDNDYRYKVRTAVKPGDAKRLGKRCKLRPDWEDVKTGIMLSLLLQKFKPGSMMAALLLSTGDAELIEGNNWGDTFWGMCDGIGKNMLGKLLMKVRDELKKSLDI